jgi:hypothetical protein
VGEDKAEHAIVSGPQYLSHFSVEKEGTLVQIPGCALEQGTRDSGESQAVCHHSQGTLVADLEKACLASFLLEPGGCVQGLPRLSSLALCGYFLDLTLGEP